MLRKTFIIRLRTAVLVLCLLCSLIYSGCGSRQDDLEDNNFIYDISEGEVTILGYSGINTKISVPAHIEGYPVTKIGKRAFLGCADLLSVVLPDTMKDISEAFCDCPDLATVDLGNGVKKINGSFSGCTGLLSVSGGGAITEMNNAFDGCSQLIDAPETPLCKTANHAFRGCRSLTDIVISEKLTALCGTFTGCSHLSGVIIPPSVTTLDRAFENCVALETVSGGENVGVYRSAFVGCTSLERLSISKKATVIEDCFTGCISLTEIDGMPETLISYTPSYNGCCNLSQILIPQMTDDHAAADFSMSDDCNQCSSAKTITVLSPFSVNEEFCKLFAGCETVHEIFLPESMLASLLRVSYDYTDRIYEGDDQSILSVQSTAAATDNVRVTENYGLIDGKHYAHIYGYDVSDFNPDTLAQETDILGFTPMEFTSYWCGYAEDSNQKDGTVAIERTYRLTLRTTGYNDGSLPESLLINGISCTVGQPE